MWVFCVQKSDLFLGEEARGFIKSLGSGGTFHDRLLSLLLYLVMIIHMHKRSFTHSLMKLDK